MSLEKEVKEYGYDEQRVVLYQTSSFFCPKEIYSREGMEAFSQKMHPTKDGRNTRHIEVLDAPGHYAVTAVTLLVRTPRLIFGEGGIPLSFGGRTGNLIGWLKEEASDRLGVEGGKARGALARPSKRTWRMAHGRRAPAGHRGRSWRASARSASPNRTS